jgi:hypothetical protein
MPPVEVDSSASHFWLPIRERCRCSMYGIDIFDGSLAGAGTYGLQAVHTVYSRLDRLGRDSGCQRYPLVFERVFD